ncbi:MAG: sigma-70 family RNA polymerase sigma factor [Bacteroidales bacterium]|nr:sigma-70 family RNA polymerase sigma factor [Bacteroidales bacterium]
MNAAASENKISEHISNKNFSEAFNLIVNQYKERLYWHIRKIVIIHEDADDVLQNTFIKVWRYLENFNQNSKIYTWLFRIATNEAITFINNKKKKEEESLGTYEHRLSDTLESDEYFDGDNAQLILQKAILKLPEKQRIVFNMKYFDEIKYGEMSKILETSTGALKASYHHAVKKIEKFVKQY